MRMPMEGHGSSKRTKCCCCCCCLTGKTGRRSPSSPPLLIPLLSTLSLSLSVSLAHPNYNCKRLTGSDNNTLSVISASNSRAVPLPPSRCSTAVIFMCLMPIKRLPSVTPHRHCFKPSLAPFLPLFLFTFRFRYCAIHWRFYYYF